MFSSFKVSRKYSTIHIISFGEHNSVFSSKNTKIKKKLKKNLSPPPPSEFKRTCGYFKKYNEK